MTVKSPHPRFSEIEPLESRIAPATIIIQAGGEGSQVGEVDYTDPNGPEDNVFINTEDDPNDPISALMGPGAVGVADTFYVKMTNDTVLKVFNQTGYQPLISGDVLGNKGITGNLIAFFVDKNLDNEVQLNELTGIALGKNVQAIVSGNVDGDIVTNFNDALQKLGGATDPLGDATSLLTNAVTNLVVSGDIAGNVVSGGQINRLLVTGSVEEILVGTAADGYTFDFNGAVAGGGDTLAVADPARGVKGVSILNATVGELGRMQAGNGGAGATGGNLTNITVLADENGFLLRAGDGGNGIAGRTTGGAGGLINNVVINGLDTGNVDDSANDLMQIVGGNGGDGLAGVSSKGGAGGTVQNVFVGYEEVAGRSTPQRSLSAMSDAVVVAGGDGGAGKTGGAGGLVKNISIFAAPTGDGNDISVLGGDGGATSLANLGSKAGVGGAVSNIVVLNPGVSAAAHDSAIVVAGGDGGSTAVGGSGGNGGAVSGLNLIGFRSEVSGGDGSDGQRVGGRGGAVSNVLLGEDSFGVRAETVNVDAGSGGDATQGKGGIGGALTGLTLVNSDLLFLGINQAAGAANGGNSKIGAGAAGGAISKITVSEFDTGVAGSAAIRSGDGGNGGDGSSAGGAGGAAGTISGVTLRTVQVDLTVNGGDGGDATLKGNGGSGGAITSFSFSSYKQTGGTEVSATVAAGDGGIGLGNAKGGVGGEIRGMDLRVGRSVNALVGGVTTALVDGGDISVTAGAGGNSLAGASGIGGALRNSSFVSFAGAVSAAAGDAGLGIKAGVGGSVVSVAFDVGTDVAILAGDGNGGGAGGNVTDVGFSRAEENLPLFGTVVATQGSAPLGAVTITAGNGSGAGRAAGNGGAVSNISGFVGMAGETTITAGNGGGVANKGAKGGDVLDVNLFGGGGATAEVRIRAGDAGDSTTARTGGVGGNVVGVGIGVFVYDTGDPANPNNVFALQPDTIIRHIAAGDGGDVALANGKGGKGGDIRGVNVHGDIGQRSGLGFGFETMGGLFAGLGGLNITIPHDATTVSVRDGAAGSVTQVTADAISSIVAGRLVTGDILTVRNLATIVDDIILNGLDNETVVDSTGAYLNFETANLIGGVVNPTEAGATYPVPHSHANTFDLANGEFVDNDGNGEFSIGDAITADTDGFVAAIRYINTLNNVRAEAVITADGGLVRFIDLNNTNGQRIAS